VLFFGVIVVWWSVKLGAQRRLIIVTSAVVVLVVGVFTVRSLVLFGQATQSSWGGSMLAAQVWVELAPNQKQVIASKHPQFKSLLEQRTPFSELTPTDIQLAQAALSPNAPAAYREPFKPNERTNWNFAGFLPLSKQWQAFAFTAIREYPEEYIEGVATSAGNYFSNASCYNWVDENTQQLTNWRDISSALLLLGASGRNCEGESSGRFVLVPWLFLLTSIVAVPLAWRRKSEAIRITYAYSVLTVLAAVATTNFIAYVEQQRMRMEVDFLLVATGIAGLAIIFQALTKKRVTSG
jgi:hypothetical protein